MTENNKEEKKSKRPTAKKRNLQSLKRKAKNRSFKASVTTSIRSLKEPSKNETVVEKNKLNEAFSLIDKGVKKGIFKLNKARRMKSQLSHLTATKASSEK